MSMPPERVIRAFGTRATPELLAGGRGTAWRVGNRVLKPAGVAAAELEWQAEVLVTVHPQGVRLVLPLRSAEGGFVVEGWMATPFVEAIHEPRRWLDILAVGRRLSAGLADLARPKFLDVRRTTWDLADRVAWGEEPIESLGAFPHIRSLAGLRGPIEALPQVIHGDLTGNVLFAESLAPAVIDFATYWRPAAYAGAIVVADALVWEGASDSLVAGLDDLANGGQLLVRALLFRAAVEVLRQPGLDPEAAARPFARAVDLVRSL
jgi:uncharacterized protein (TIGR02569 family)